MFGHTHNLRFTNQQHVVTFQGFTKSRFKTLYIDTAERLNAQDKVYSYNNRMKNSLMDLESPEVQRGLHQSIRCAEAAVSAAAKYFETRPTRWNSPSRLEKIFLRHFKNNAPTVQDRDEVEHVFKLTAAGLMGNIVIKDLFAAADNFGPKSGLVWGAEGQVAFDEQTDRAYINTLLEEDGLERANDIMRDFLARAESLDIYIDFSLLKSCNKYQIARIIVHEATHKFAYTGDYAYMSNSGKFNLMTAKDALKNADSYAYAAISVLAESALTPEKIRRLGLALVP
jgi:hypothetical protein